MAAKPEVLGGVIMPKQNGTERILTSIVSYPERGSGGSNRYRGNCSPKLIEDLIGFFKPSEICDYMCGSGTTKDAAAVMGIQSRCYDLHSGFDIMNSEIAERPEMIFWHPPYWDIIIYSDVMYKAADVQARYGYDPRHFDLSRIARWEEFVKAMNYAMMKQFCSLEKGGRMAVLVGDIKKKGKLYSMLFELVKPGTLENVIIKAQYNCFSNQTRYSGRFIPILHEYLLILKKGEPLLYPILMTQNKEIDIRDMPGATWRDVVAAVLECSKEAVPLTYIYEQVEPHSKAKKNQWWREKVRQTLQSYPDHFLHTERGMWALKRAA
jgi:hypothetical protein